MAFIRPPYATVPCILKAESSKKQGYISFGCSCRQACAAAFCIMNMQRSEYVSAAEPNVSTAANALKAANKAR